MASGSDRVGKGSPPLKSSVYKKSGHPKPYKTKNG